MDWELYAWLKRGSRRQSVLIFLSNSDKPLTTNEISSGLKIPLSQASFSLNELCYKNLVICLNPSDYIGKLYSITELGREILSEL